MQGLGAGAGHVSDSGGTVMGCLRATGGPHLAGNRHGFYHKLSPTGHRTNGLGAQQTRAEFWPHYAARECWPVPWPWAP